MRRALATAFLVAVFPGTAAPSEVPDHDGVVEIKIGRMKPVEIGVETPEGEFLHVRSDLVTCPGVTVEGSTVRIEVARLVGREWDPDGRPADRRVFTTTGLYRIYVADNLETELENSMSVTHDYVNTGERRETPIEVCD